MTPASTAWSEPRVRATILEQYQARDLFKLLCLSRDTFPDVVASLYGFNYHLVKPYEVPLTGPRVEIYRIRVKHLSIESASLSAVGDLFTRFPNLFSAQVKETLQLQRHSEPTVHYELHIRRTVKMTADGEFGLLETTPEERQLANRFNARVRWTIQFGPLDHYSARRGFIAKYMNLEATSLPQPLLQDLYMLNVNATHPHKPWLNMLRLRRDAGLRCWNITFSGDRTITRIRELTEAVGNSASVFETGVKDATVGQALKLNNWVKMQMLESIALKFEFAPPTRGCHVNDDDEWDDTDSGGVSDLDDDDEEDMEVEDEEEGTMEVDSDASGSSLSLLPHFDGMYLALIVKIPWNVFSNASYPLTLLPTPDEIALALAEYPDSFDCQIILGIDYMAGMFNYEDTQVKLNAAVRKARKALWDKRPVEPKGWHRSRPIHM